MQVLDPGVPRSHLTPRYLHAGAGPGRAALPSNPSAPSVPPCRGWARACRAMQSGSYEEVVPACSEEIQSAGAHRLEATLLRGTLHQLTGQNQAARDDYTTVIEDNASSAKVGGLREVTKGRGWGWGWGVSVPRYGRRKMLDNEWVV